MKLENATKRDEYGTTEQRDPEERCEGEKDSHDDVAVPLDSIEEPSLQIPQWFLDNCVKTKNELAASKIALIVREYVPGGRTSSQEQGYSTTDTYEIASAVYEPLLDVFIGTLDGHEGGLRGEKCFRNDAIHISFPKEGRVKGGSGFLSATVEHFAQDVGADLISFGVEDFIDLIQHFTGLVLEAAASHDGSSDRNYDFEDGSVKDTQLSPSARSTFLTQVVSSPGIKEREDSHLGAEQHRNPLVIFLPGFQYLLGLDQGNFLKGLCEANSNAIVVISTEDQEPVIRSERYSRFKVNRAELHDSYSHPWFAALRNIGKNPRAETIYLAPVGTKTQQVLCDTRIKFEMFYELENIRVLQRSIRRISSKHQSLSIMQPFAKWDFLENSSIHTRLSKKELLKEEVNELVQTVSRSLEDEYIIQTVLRYGRRLEALDEWCSFVREEPRDSRWSGFSKKTQGVIKEVENGEAAFGWEQQLLNLLVDPNEVEEGWSDIALEPEVKDNIMRLIHQPFSTGASAPGILKHGRIGGALLYGPPGTGKTRLARVLARESNATMICVSFADIESKYVGNTEKAIKGLFNLGRMLSPCTIFFDEADSLFRHRKPEDQDWVRSRTNQLLHEMDGLKTTGTSPFVILATNVPRDLDHAVLRRVPSRIYIGLPSKDDRIRIFQIHLKDEILDADVDMNFLGEKSWKYSGSDIKTVCVQAALICDTFVDDEMPRRLLKRRHFEEAFQRSPTSVSHDSLSGIMAFAREFDHVALEKLAQEGKLEDRNTAERVGIESTNVPVHQVHAQRTESSSLLCARSLDMGNSKEHCINRSEGNDGEMGMNVTGDLEQPYRYIPLRPDSTQIRVLSIEPQTVSDVTDNALLRCTLKEIDLDDWTDYYRAWLSAWREQFVRVFKAPDTEKYRSATWRHTSAAFFQDRDYWDQSVRAYLQNWQSQVWREGDTPFQEIETIFPRFNWGDFIALSYVWGNSGVRRSIRLNGHRFSVTFNLYQALLHLRDSIEVRRMGFYVWIDAICINRHDLDERAAQVKIMGTIYSQALVVRAFLGQAGPRILMELQALRSLIDTIRLSGRSRQLSYRDLGWAKIREMGIERSFWAAMSALSSLPYWKRLWTLQETVLAPSILYHYGQQAFTSQELLHCCSFVNRGWDEEQPNLGSWKNFYQKHHVLGTNFLLIHDRILLERSQGRSVPDENDLAQLMSFVLRLEATDPRDKVYGVLAILPPQIALRICPNYDSSVRASDAFRTFSKLYFQATRNLNLLAKWPRTSMRIKGLPTWALNLTKELDLDTSGPAVKNDPRYDATVTAHDANLGMHMTEVSFSEDNLLLHCEGVVLDTFMLLGAAHSTLDVPVELHSDIQQKLTEPTRFTREETKLDLARVFFGSSTFQFDGSLSVFDIPWLEKDEVEYNAKHYPDLDGDGLSLNDKTDSSWLRCYNTSMIAPFFRLCMYGNEELNIRGQSLRSYFTSTEKICSDMEGWCSLSPHLVYHISYKRLCVSRTGLLGMTPVLTQLSDKIVVLSECDMPLVLRPRGETYEVIGSCFIQGLMRGEVADGIKQGRFHLERICLC